MRELSELLQLSARGMEEAGELGEGRARGSGNAPAAAGTGSGAAAAAAVLNAVDEDEEGDEEAGVPGEFEYFTDAEADDEE